MDTLNIGRYLKDNKFKIIYIVLIFLILNIVLYTSYSIDLNNLDLLYLNILLLFVTMVYFGFSYFNWNRKYKKIYENLKENKDIDIFLNNEKIEDEITSRIVENKDELRLKETNELKKELDEINDYITKWIHEIKIPISVLELISDRIEAINEFDISNELRIEIERLTFLVDQVLYISRSTDFSEDLYIEEIDLNKIIKDIIKKNMNILISKDIEVEIGKLNRKIYSDRKWVSYTIDQIINNSCKYMRDGEKIKIYFQELEDSLVVKIKDTGIGISKKDIDRIFDKGFTGENGRKFRKSTGMGLYLSKKMGERLNYSLEIESEVDSYTLVKIIFKNMDSYFNVTKM